jgi:hypothetical protein
MEPEVAHLLAVTLVAPMARPRIIQLSPVPGNIYTQIASSTILMPLIPRVLWGLS